MVAPSTGQHPAALSPLSPNISLTIPSTLSHLHPQHTDALAPCLALSLLSQKEGRVPTAGVTVKLGPILPPPPLAPQSLSTLSEIAAELLLRRTERPFPLHCAISPSRSPQSPQ